MDFIKKFFDEFKAIPSTDSSTNWTFTEYVPEDSYFTASEQQQLKNLLSERIFQLECIKAHDLLAARGLKQRGYKESAGEYYKFIEKTQKKINTLAKLQRKVKHTLETRG